jgi:hypothetical protein
VIGTPPVERTRSTYRPEDYIELGVHLGGHDANRLVAWASVCGHQVLCHLVGGQPPAPKVRPLGDPYQESEVCLDS